ncbi:MAG TPA: arylsulfotransferase family protein [Solirubrobacteraceae bacterium]|jgi:hypothetical protein|nr:arylsulfotransferase family protein [Solirubrobacteraceae bacterium]
MDRSAGKLARALDPRRTRRPGFALAMTLAALLALAGQASSARAAPAVAISPLNGTPDASPDTQISFLGVPPSEIAGVSVTGSKTGAHHGKLLAYATAPGASFVPDGRFSEGESVTASALIGPKGHQAHVQTRFTIAHIAGYASPPSTTSKLPVRHDLEQSFVTQPKLKPSVVHVTANAGASPGDIFLTPTAGYGQAGLMIIDGAGRLVWFHPVSRGEVAANLQVQSFRGAPVLTWWHGQVPGRLGAGFGRDEIVDSSYRPLASVGAGNGYQTDLHEFQITPQGSAFLTAVSLVYTDLRSVGGSRNGILQDSILQEIDVPTGLVMFEWHADGHIPFGDSYSHVLFQPSEPWDFFHINSVSLDPWGDGNFIVSSRNTWAAYEIDHVTGEVLWRLGGRRSSFKMGPGTGTAWQHDVRWQPDRTLTIFDNGAYPSVHRESRAIRESIDWAHRKVSLVARYAGKIVAGSQGNSQTLQDGNVFVGWGEAPYMTEYNPSGQITFSARLAAPTQSYRTFRFPWQATPASEPALALKKSSSGAVTAYASWNGATSVAAWRVLGGASSSNMTPLLEAPRTGFETAIAVPEAQAVMAVQALGADGSVLATSSGVSP